MIIGMATISLLVLSSCKHKNNKIDTLGELKEAADKVNDETKKATDRWEERKAKGDTIAIPYKDLQAYLPDISGYTRDEGPKGSQMNTPGLGSWSQAEQEYKNGDKSVKIEIVDYNAAQAAFTGVTALYKLGYSMEDDSKKQGSIDLGIKDVAAYETIYKQDQRAEMALIAGDRFLIQVNCNGSNDPDFLHSIVKSMKLDELASK
jgi:hypothetical protein